jgi:CBS domain-containing protein
MKVRDVMTSRVQTCCPESNLAATIENMWRADCGALPVVDSLGRVIGIITDRDIAIALGTKNRPASDVSVGEVMSSRVCVCSPEDDVDVAMHTIAAHKVRRLPVVDADGDLTGIVTLNDIALHAGASPEAAIRITDVGRTLRAVCEHGAFATAVH